MSIEVNENEDGTLTISWDENDPNEAIFNTWTAEDFIRLISEYAEKALAESEYANHPRFQVNQTAEELQEDIANAEKFVQDNYIQATNEETYGDQGNEQQET